VVGDLGEDLVVEGRGLTLDQRHQRLALEEAGWIDPGDLAQGRIDVELGDHQIDDLAAVEPVRPAHDHHHPDAAVEQGRLGLREGEAVVGGADDQGVVCESTHVEAVQHRTDALVQRAHTRLEGGHVVAGDEVVGQVLGRQRIERVAHRVRRREVPVGLEEPDRHEERLLRALHRVERARSDQPGEVRVETPDFVVADHPWVLRDVLLADEDGAVAGLLQRVDQVLAVVVELPAAMGESGHAVVVAMLTGQQGRTTSRAGRRRTEGPPEERALVGQQLHVRRRHRVAVGLDVAATVMRVDVEDVGAIRRR